MSAKRKRFDTRTVLIVLLVIVIIASAYIVITNLPAEENYLSPEEVTRNPQLYLNDEIIVEGYYEPDIEGGSIVSLPTDPLSAPPGSWLKLDISNVGNESLPLYSDIKYHFTGLLTETIPTGSPAVVYVFVVEKVERV